jgi:hypothetical protein
MKTVKLKEKESISEFDTVFESSVYDMFSHIDGNRDVNKLHVKRLVESFGEKHLISPIICNENFQIIDGQHRFEAAKKLGLPVYFIINRGYGLKEVQMLNTHGHNWTKKTYLESYCEMGLPEYLKFKGFMQMFPEFGFSACEAMLTGQLGGDRKKNDKSIAGKTNKSGVYLIKDFNEGNLKIADFESAINAARKIKEIAPYYDGFSRISFVRAMLGIFRISEYSHERLIERLRANPGKMHHCNNVSQYKALIEEIYNYRSRKKVSLRF